MRILIRRLSALLLIYFGLLLILFLFQRDILYAPSGSINSNLLPKNFQENYLITDDNVKIYYWYKKAASKQKTIIYFQGNAGNISGRVHKFIDLANAGYGILAVSYRGYANSEGNPSQEGLILDGKAAIDFLKNKQALQDDDIILYGESIGTGVAMQLAENYNFHFIILESPFSSIESVAQSQYWFAPISLLLKDKFDSLSKTDVIASPILIFHGVKDQVVSYSEAKLLYSKIKSPKRMISVKGAGHVNFESSLLIEEISKFIKEISSLKMNH